MPGKKMRSIKRPRTYEALRKKGYSKSKAAKISNAQAKKARRKKSSKKRKRKARRKKS